MTEATEKKKADFFIFQEVEGQKDQIVGSVYMHGKGKGFNIVMGHKCFKVFPRKDEDQQSEVGA